MWAASSLARFCRVLEPAVIPTDAWPPQSSPLTKPALRSVVALPSLPALPTVLLLTLFGLAIVSGLLIAIGAYPILFLLLGGVVGFGALFVPLEWLIWMLLILTFFIQGPLASALLSPVVAWIPYGLAVLVFVRSLLERLSIAKPAPQSEERPGNSGAIPALWMVYMSIILISALINRSPWVQIAVGLKTYFPFWAVTFALLFNRWSAEQLDRLWRWIPWGLALQLPVVLYQVLVLVPQRQQRGDETAFDAVVGTFGGDGGGNSSFLVLYGIAASVLAVSRAQFKLEGWAVAILTIAFSIALTLAGEVKAAFFWVPIAVGVGFHDHLIRRPGFLIGVMGGLAAFVVGTAMVYEAIHWTSRGAEHVPIEMRIERASRYFFNPSEINYETGEISRGASLALWVDDQYTDWPNRLIGFGPAASRAKSVVAVGVIAQRFAPLAIAATTLSMLLWDAGVIGALLFTGLILVTLLYAMRLIRDPRLSATHRASARMVASLLAVFVTMLFYDRALVDEPCTQLLLALLIGYVGWLRAHRPLL